MRKLVLENEPDIPLPVILETWPAQLLRESTIIDMNERETLKNITWEMSAGIGVAHGNLRFLRGRILEFKASLSKVSQPFLKTKYKEKDWGTAQVSEHLLKLFILLQGQKIS